MNMYSKLMSLLFLLSFGIAQGMNQMPELPQEIKEQILKAGDFSAVIENSRSFSQSSKQWHNVLANLKLVETFINSVAQKFKVNPLIVALALGSEKSLRWFKNNFDTIAPKDVDNLIKKYDNQSLRNKLGVLNSTNPNMINEIGKLFGSKEIAFQDIYMGLLFIELVSMNDGSASYERALKNIIPYLRSTALTGVYQKDGKYNLADDKIDEKKGDLAYILSYYYGLAQSENLSKFIKSFKKDDGINFLPYYFWTQKLCTGLTQKDGKIIFILSVSEPNEKDRGAIIIRFDKDGHPDATFGDEGIVLMPNFWNQLPLF